MEHIFPCGFHVFIYYYYYYFVAHISILCIPWTADPLQKFVLKKKKKKKSVKHFKGDLITSK